MIRALTKLEYSLDRLPCRSPFSLARAFPAALLGPVDLMALRRLASTRARVRTGGLRSDIDLPPPVMASDGDLGHGAQLAYSELGPGLAQNARRLCLRIGTFCISYLTVCCQELITLDALEINLSSLGSTGTDNTLYQDKADHGRLWQALNEPIIFP